MEKLRPLKQNVLIQVHELEEETPGGIILIPHADEKPITGDVIGVGDQVVDVKENDTVLFSKYSGSDFKVNGKPVVIMPAREILAVLEDDPI